MKRILVSACLMGEAVRYDGKAKPLSHPQLEQWQREGRLLAFCPEMAGGFAVPRAPAEIADGRNGSDVLDGSASVIDRYGLDVSSGFLQGAETALAFAREHGCVAALLIDGSPSCGSGFIYNGSFSGERHIGRGVTAALLEAAGIPVFSPARLNELALFLER
jgi:uncharacterized protein YbbK (DUF523 family)